MIPYLDPKAQYLSIKDEVDLAIARVVIQGAILRVHTVLA
jgi:hypothetical protein